MRYAIVGSCVAVGIILYIAAMISTTHPEYIVACPLFLIAGALWRKS